MPRNGLQAAAHRRLDSADANAARFVDLQLDVLDDETGELLGRFGGRWDRRKKDWRGESRRSRIIRLHKGQLESFEWFCDWFDKHQSNMPRDYAALFAGGRRGGKSFNGVLMCVLFAIANPGAIVWVVCPTDKDFEEVEDYLSTFMPKSWSKFLGAPWWRYSLVNGSRIVLRSGYDPNAMKKGRVDFALINEGQKQDERVYTNLRGGLGDTGGACIVAANPPDVGDKGDWVGDFAVDAQAGLRQAKYFFFNPFDNPHIDHAALRALADEMDEHTFNIQVLGMFLGPIDNVFYNWSRAHNERATPDLGDITAAFTLKKDGTSYDQIVGLDVQKYPYMAAVVFKVFANPQFPGNMERALFWVVDEIALEGGDEVGIADELRERGYLPSRTLIVLDASGWWQQSERDKEKLSKQNITGRGSFHVLKRQGFEHIVRPDRKMAKNPEVVERCRAACARIQTKSGERYVYADPRVKQTCKAIRLWRHLHGKPSRSSEWSHLGDGFSYVLWRYFPRRRSSVTTGTGIASA